MGGEGAASKMVLAPDNIARETATRQEEITHGGAVASEPPSVSTMRTDRTHISNESLLAAGGTVAGAAFLGSALGGVIGAVAGAIAGLSVAVYTAKLKGKEGARRS